jgi:hypothetical protein
MKRLLRNLLLIIVPIGSLVVVVNYCVDPANIFFGREYVAGISDILAKGHNVDNVANYDERALQEQMVRKLPYQPDIVVLGSSRVMELGTSFFPGKKVLNCGVSHANINDVLAITGLLDSMGRLPEEIVINLDPHLICLGGTSEWQSLSPYHRFYLQRIHHPETTLSQPLFFSKAITLLSFEYFEKSLAFVSQHKTKHYQDVGKERPAKYGRFWDGTICYPPSYDFPDTAKVAGDARVVGNREETTLDPEKLQQLNDLLDYLATRKVKVMLVMLPYHMEYYREMNGRYRNIFPGYDTLFRKMARERDIPILGGFDAVGMGIPENKFYDSYHCSKEAIKKTLNYN